MNQEIITQMQFFMVSVLWGAFILIAYDVLRILRRIIRHNTFFVAVQDILFWAAASVFIFAMIYVKNSGIIRGFSIMGMGIGMLIYHYIFSDWVVILISRIILLLLRPFRVAIKYICKGIKFLVNRTKRLITRIYGRLKNKVKSVKISVSRHMQKRKADAKARRKIKKEKDSEKANQNTKRKKKKKSKKKVKKKSNERPEKR